MRILITALLAVSLAACGTFTDSLDSRPNAGPCPPVGSLYNAARIVDFGEAEQVYGNIQYTGEIVDVRSVCRYVEDDPVRAELEVDFAFGRGPSGTDNRHDFAYWVAVTRRDGKVLHKEWFDIRADFSEQNVTGASDVLQRIVIPRVDDSISAANFEIIVGFELTESQLTFNKEGHRFRLSAGQ
ncbi:MAG: hypothetical protein AAF613_04010 [Pseudomonadota bacterium]